MGKMNDKRITIHLNQNLQELVTIDDLYLLTKYNWVKCYICMQLLHWLSKYGNFIWKFREIQWYLDNFVGKPLKELQAINTTRD